jgi:ubiquinone/menaquinone biosynthesis C-methylase UbiE
MPSTSAPRSARFWDKIAPGYARKPVKDQASYGTTLDLTRARLSPGHDVLEIGCGTGTTALKLADAARHILATDISPQMIRIGEEKARESGIANVDFLAATVEDTRLDCRTFDAVLAFNLLHLVEDLDGTLRRVASLMKPGAHFISKTVCLAGQGWYFKPMISVMQAFGKAPCVNFLTIDGLERAIESAGFEILETGDYPAKPPSRFVVARKA